MPSRLRAQSHKPVVWLLTGLWISAILSPPLSLVLFRSWGLWMRMPGFGGLQKAAAMRAEGLPETQVLEQRQRRPDQLLWRGKHYAVNLFDGRP